MFPIMSALLAFVAGLCRSRASLCLENLALRHQLGVYKQTVYRPRLRWTDRVFLTLPDFVVGEEPLQTIG